MAYEQQGSPILSRSIRHAKTEKREKDRTRNHRNNNPGREEEIGQPHGNSPRRSTRAREKSR